jgi:hypothetical protein
MAAARWAGLVRPSPDGIGPRTYRPEAIDSSAARLQAIAANYRALVVMVPSRGLWIGHELQPAFRDVRGPNIQTEGRRKAAPRHRRTSHPTGLTTG